MDTCPSQSIRNLYPHLTDAELAEAEVNLDRYLALVLRIYERLTAHPASYAQFRALLARYRTVSCTPPRSSPSSEPPQESAPSP
jgi:hypothetical protein